ncbi:hypothetical protein SK128_001794 [Halocaridina rubra]|uniref:Uncharacterized protein n=1 Tax=Halocaridina rubra TaxID=373956 RepID=A0AAN8XCY4_HALRR
MQDKEELKVVSDTEGYDGGQESADVNSEYSGATGGDSNRNMNYDYWGICEVKVKNGDRAVACEISVRSIEGGPRIEFKCFPTCIRIQFVSCQKRNSALQRSKQENHNYWVNKSSHSATWYREATKLEPSPVSKYTPRSLAVTIARLRLGYKCCWEIIENPRKECAHCRKTTDKALLHYLLECPKTNSLRNGLNMEPQHPNATVHAAKIVKDILDNMDTHLTTLETFEPPRDEIGSSKALTAAGLILSLQIVKPLCSE